ncbi:anthranilate synthase component 1 [Paraferrimonas sedimenticola]|uniref:Anthranilate synthase component 1 n=1 Tax=Paraferrimonas sedimenticola TaxID=375674 RepID=A0AA37RTC8_9GAMM|nr:anthranilate synthase component 1 [Paraferrimonas sedimenticola]GLP94924.1 anthranilate synthase component 1 [Paraferrimonas sedimenticola]
MNAPVSVPVERLSQSAPYVDDPLSQYRTLCPSPSHTMLLESAEIDSKDHLKSLIMVKAALQIRCDENGIHYRALSANGEALLPAIAKQFAQFEPTLDADGLTLNFPKADTSLDEDARLKATSPLDGLRQLLDLLVLDEAHRDSLFLGGALGYDLIEHVEPLPTVPNGDNPCPDYLFYLAEVLLTVDHQSGVSELIGLVMDGNDQAREQVAAEMSQAHKRLRELQQSSVVPASLVTIEQQAQENISDADFRDCVNGLKEHIVAGDIFQVVPSRSFSLPCPNPLGAYQALRVSNPSPYMFYLQSDDFSLFGASPESALKYDKASNQVEVYPIAGTRIRGKDAQGNIDADLDSRIELELRLDQKELAEHLMLVDLARNDVARISQAGTRKVAELLKVDRYSHVMHLVSRVTGQLRDDLDALHAYQACMNMGTLVGAPKIRAAQLVREVEGARRGSYGGAVGYVNGRGDMDTCIVIRSAMVHQGQAHVQAGAGVVYDSDPQSEADETRNKAQAVINAIRAGGGQ